MTDVKIKGSRKHEEDFAELIGGTRVPGSGSQWHNKGDAANQHFELFAFRGDCKCTQGQSIAVSRAMIKKLLDDAGGERPALPLRFYKNERLDVEYDFVAVLADDFGELLENAREAAELKARIAQAVIVSVPDHLTDEQLAELEQQLTAALASGKPLTRMPEEITTLPDETFSAMSAALIAAQDRQAELEGQLTEMRERADDMARQPETTPAAPDGQVVHHDSSEIERLQADLADRDRSWAEAARENDRLAGLLHKAHQDLEVLRAAQPAPQRDPDIPQTPWMVVHQVKLPGDRVALTGVWWDENGHSHPTVVRTVRLEPDSPVTERLIVNDRRVREGDLYISGRLRLRVGAR